MATFAIWHPDIEDFIKVKREDGRLRQFNLSVLIDDEFMDAVVNDLDYNLVFPVRKIELEKGIVSEKDLLIKKELFWSEEYCNEAGYIVEENKIVCKVYKTVKAKELFNTIMKSTYDYAEPGFLLIDEINRMNNNWFCEKIRATNPCVIGSTKIITKKGQVEIQSVVDQEIEVWNGFEWSTVTPRVTGTNQEIRHVMFTWGKSLFCTPYHKFILEDGRRVECKDLKPYDRLMQHTHPSMGGMQPQLIVMANDPAGMADKVYCFNEPINHSAVFNDILTANCGEQPLPEYGSCLLGSVNLTKMLTDDFKFDWDKYKKTVKVFTRMLDNVVESNGLPLERQRHEIYTKRRHGMGITGLGSTLALMGIKYGSEEALKFTEEVCKQMALIGFREGVELAKEKGCAPILCSEENRDKFVQSNYMKRLFELDKTLKGDILKHGCRFTHHTSIAPTGTMSLSVCNNVSNGIEPTFAHKYTRNVIKEGEKAKRAVDVYSFEALVYKELYNTEQWPEHFVTTDEISPDKHIAMQSVAQKWVDSSISKTINVPTDIPFDEFKNIYLTAYKMKLKGCTTFRFNPEAFQGVLVKEDDLKATKYQFTLDDGEVITVCGNDMVEYEGSEYTAANLFDALKEGYYGKF